MAQLEHIEAKLPDSDDQAKIEATDLSLTSGHYVGVALEEEK